MTDGSTAGLSNSYNIARAGSNFAPDFGTPDHHTSAGFNTHRSSSESFGLLTAFIKHEDLLLRLVSHLPTSFLLPLYAISKTFHYLLQAHPTAFVMASVRTWAPGSDETVPWRYHRGLCLKDPEKRVKVIVQRLMGG